MGTKKEIRNILIFLPYGIGDIIMSIPALRRLFTIYNNSQVYIVIANYTQQKLLNSFFDYPINTIIYKNSKLINLYKLFYKICKVKPEYIYAPLINHTYSRKLFFLFTTKRTFVPLNAIAFPFFNLIPSKVSLERFQGHQVNYYIHFFNQGHNKLPLELAKHSEFKFQFNKNIIFENKNIFKIVLGISCGVFERHKIPSPKFFAHLVNKLSLFISCNFYVIGNSNDISLINEFESYIDNKNLIKKIINDNITDTLDSMSQYDLGITGTTGQGHMMSIGNFPLLVLSGVTEPLESGPYAERVKIWKHNFDCGPCYQTTFKYGCKQIQCMDMLSLDLGVKYALELLNNNQFGKNWLFDGVKKHATSQFQIQKILMTMKNPING
jgi:ADP-heptose:LPS heptosyltransferase